MVAVRNRSVKIILFLDTCKLYLDKSNYWSFYRQYMSAICLSDAFLTNSHNSKKPFRWCFAYARIPFGLCNSRATFCRLVDTVIRCDLEPEMFVYLNDITIATETFVERHIPILPEIATRLEQSGLTISTEKSQFCMKELCYLDYIVAKDGIRPNPKKSNRFSICRHLKPSRKLENCLACRGDIASFQFFRR